MQGKGKFKIEFEGKIKIKKKSPAYSRAHILFNIWLEHSHNFKSRECGA